MITAKKAQVALLVFALAISFVGSWQMASATQTVETARTYRIGFHLWKPGKIYDEALQGIRDGLDLAGIKYEEVVVESQRSKELAQENLKKLDAMDLDIIYSLSSAGTKIAQRLALKTPVIATVINHPASLGVGNKSEGPGTVITGTSYYVDAKKQIALYRKLFPKIDKVAMILDANNPAGTLAEEPFMRSACEQLGIAFESVKVTDAAHLTSAAQKLVEAGAGLIVVPTNRLVYANLDAVLAVTNAASVPVVSMNKQGVENGALAALFADTYNLGRLTVEMVRRVVVDGEDAANVDYEFVTNPDIIVNVSSANAINFEFPPEVLGSATIVVE